MKFGHLAMAIGGMMALAACTAGNGYEPSYYSEDAHPANQCAAAHAETLKGVNWGTAKPVDITVKDGVYSPATFRLVHGQPYLLRYHNEDETVRSVASNEFFTRAAVGSVIVDGKINKPGGCILRVKLAPNATTMVQVLPFREGRYRWSDNLGPNGFLWFTSSGGLLWSSRKDMGDIVVR